MKSNCLNLFCSNKIRKKNSYFAGIVCFSVLSSDVINPNAAGIDVGSRSHYVTINQDINMFGNLEYIPKIFVN